MNDRANIDPVVRIDESLGIVRTERSTLQRRLIGELMVDAGLIEGGKVDSILQHAAQTGLRFGETCVALRFIDLEQLRQVLAHQFGLPIATPGSSGIDPEVVAAYNTDDAVVGDLHTLRSEVMLRWLQPVDEGRRALAIVSPLKGEGRSFVAANLAVTFAQIGYRTLLIDADLREGRQHRLFGLSNRQGLSTLLSDQMVGRAAIQQIDVMPDLAVMPAGPVPPNPVDLLSKAAFGQFLEWSGKLFDVVIVDAPSALEHPEARMVAAAVGGCVMVARKGVSRYEPMRTLSRTLMSTGVTVIGSVMISR